MGILTIRTLSLVSGLHLRILLLNTKSLTWIVAGYLGIPIYICLILGWKFWHHTKRVHPANADIWSGKDKVDREEALYLEKRAATPQKHGRLHWIYRNIVGTVF